MTRIWFYLFILFSLIIALGPIEPGFARTETIAAVVNEDAISMSDMNDRLKLILTSSGLPDNEEIRSKILPQVMGSLIE